MTTFGSTTENDGVPIDRGPAHEDRKTEAELRGRMQDIARASDSLDKAATIHGLRDEVLILKSMVEDMTEQHNKVIGLISTMRAELDQFKQQWNIERMSWLANGGSTTPEDCDGPEPRSGN